MCRNNNKKKAFKVNEGMYCEFVRTGPVAAAGLARVVLITERNCAEMRNRELFTWPATCCPLPLLVSGRSGAVGSAGFARVTRRERAADQRSHRREPAHHVQLAAFRSGRGARRDNQTTNRQLVINAGRIACAICRNELIIRQRANLLGRGTRARASGPTCARLG